MPVRRENIPSSETSSRQRRPATTPENREARMVSLAESLAERQLRDGTASSPVVVHYLKLGSSRERIEQKRLEGEVELQKAKIEAMASTQRLESLYVDAMKAMRGYQGNTDLNSDDDA